VQAVPPARFIASYGGAVEPSSNAVHLTYERVSTTEQSVATGPSALSVRVAHNRPPEIGPSPPLGSTTRAQPHPDHSSDLIAIRLALTWAGERQATIDLVREAEDMDSRKSLRREPFPFREARTMVAYAIIEAPSALGLFPGGVERLPEALLDAGLATATGTQRARVPRARTGTPLALRGCVVQRIVRACVVATGTERRSTRRS
jgi:hypothetical protein